MSFRRKLLLLFALTVAVSVAAVAWLVSAMTRRAFQLTNDQRTAALVTQFQRQFAQQGDEIARRVELIAGSEPISRMAAAVERSPGDLGGYFDMTRSLAEGYRLDFLEFVDSKGTIISSAQWPAKFGYPESAFANFSAWANQPAFLKHEELQDSAALGLFAVRTARVGEHPLYVIGGRRLDKSFLSALDLPADIRALLYQNRGDHFSPEWVIDPTANSTIVRLPEKLAPLIDAVRQENREMSVVVHWTGNKADDELFHAFPLRGADKDRAVLAILLVANSRRGWVELERRIRDSAMLVGGGGILLAVILGSWAAARVTRPVEQLAMAAQDVAGGNWNARVEVSGHDEVAQLADSFNRMTAELLTQKERLVQAERVAAWRELARRLAHELKNPLFPLQLTVENLLRARQSGPQQFEEIFNESSTTLLAEISNLKTIVSRFSEFSKMPQPQMESVQINDLVRGVAQLFQAQFEAPGRPAIQCKLELANGIEPIAADPQLLHRALSNLVLNAMDAMPQGGALTLRTLRRYDKVAIEIADTGSGLTREECERIFTPYYTSKQHGTGLGLAIVQSVVSDHGGTISVSSEPGRGTTFVIELLMGKEKLQTIAAKDSPAKVSASGGLG